MLLIRLLFDFGLVVLIWLVQLIIYPSFAHYSTANLKNWHRIYTGRIALVVVPLMLGQLGIAAWQLYKEVDFYTVVSFILIIILWGLTFYIFVPLHSAIEKNSGDSIAIRDLVNRNWIRTALWTIIFFWSLFRFI